MTQGQAGDAGRIQIGRGLEVARLGYGAMRLTGPGIWGPPRDRAAAMAVLQRAVELGVDFIDTADAYGPDVSEPLIREALHPFGRVHVATKGGNTRPGPDQWVPRGDPEYLIGQAMRSRELLGVEQIDLWQLHRVDPTVPRDEQFGAIRDMLASGIIRNAGLSEVDVETIAAAREIFPVASVQNLYNLGNRGHEPVLDYCEDAGIVFIPWFPLAAGRLTSTATLLDVVGSRYGATSAQVALAWLLRRSPVLLPIPGTASIAHLEENIAAASIALDDEDYRRIDEASRG
jgi:aryl-alcohol dehydrogenase-like predicted oxidoreductase